MNEKPALWKCGQIVCKHKKNNNIHKDIIAIMDAADVDTNHAINCTITKLKTAIRVPILKLREHEPWTSVKLCSLHPRT